jgi:hypothetical protein
LHGKSQGNDWIESTNQKKAQLERMSGIGEVDENNNPTDFVTQPISYPNTFNNEQNFQPQENFIPTNQQNFIPFQQPQEQNIFIPNQQMYPQNQVFTQNPNQNMNQPVYIPTNQMNQPFVPFQQPQPVYMPTNQPFVPTNLSNQPVFMPTNQVNPQPIYQPLNAPKIEEPKPIYMPTNQKSNPTPTNEYNPTIVNSSVTQKKSILGSIAARVVLSFGLFWLCCCCVASTLYPIYTISLSFLPSKKAYIFFGIGPIFQLILDICILVTICIGIAIIVVYTKPKIGIILSVVVIHISFMF